jgi:hypothetical protein
MKIHVSKNGQQLGPYTIEQVNAEASAGRVTPADLARIEGGSSWQPLSMVPGFNPPPRRFHSNDPHTMNAPKKSIFMAADFFCALAAAIIYIIILEMSGYDIRDHGLPSWWFVPTPIIFIVIRVAWSRRKTSRQRKAKRIGLIGLIG